MRDFFHHLFTIDPKDPLKLFVQIASLVTAAFTIGVTLASKTGPWIRAKLASRSLEKRIGAELYSAASLERSIRYYIPPLCQDLDPAGGDEPRKVYGVKQKLFDALDDALEHPTEYKYLILLADSGMGKTSALINYYARHLRRWRKKYKLALIPLGIPDVDDRIKEIEDKRNTVLFLDALDEDTLAIIDYVERLRLLLKATQDFHRVLISCRTQFFSKDEEIPKGTGILKVAARAAGEPAEYYFHKIYLSPFTDKQVAQYLKCLYPIWKIHKRRWAQRIVRKIPNLVVRPMLLAHIDDLVKAKRVIDYSYELYEEMVEAWLKREQGIIQETGNLRQFSERLAVDLYLNRLQRGAERIPKSELTVLANEWNIPIEDWKLSGRSLLNRDADKGFKFAHRSILEYFFVKQFLDGELRGLEVDWTDQMLSFLWEMMEHYYKGMGMIQFNSSGSNLYMLDIGSKGKSILISAISQRLKQPVELRSRNLLLQLVVELSGIIAFAPDYSGSAVLIWSHGKSTLVTMRDELKLYEGFHGSYVIETPNKITISFRRINQREIETRIQRDPILNPDKIEEIRFSLSDQWFSKTPYPKEYMTILIPLHTEIAIQGLILLIPFRKGPDPTDVNLLQEALQPLGTILTG